MVLADRLNSGGKTMKKVFWVLMMVFLATMLIVSCDDKQKEPKKEEHNFAEDGICTICGGYKCGDNVAVIFDKTAKTLTVRGTGDIYNYQLKSSLHWNTLEADKLIIEEGVTRIGDFTFYKCKAKTVEIGKDVKSIGQYAFSDMTATKMLVFAEDGTLSEIKSSAFADNHALESVVLPPSLRILGASAFFNCTSLKSLTLNEGLEEIGSTAVRNTPIETLHLPSTYNPGKESFVYFWNSDKLTAITVAEGNPYLKAEDGILYSKDGKTLIGVPAGKTTVTVADTVETIGKGAFFMWQGSKIDLPESVTKIEGIAFSYCDNLSALSIGSKIESIDLTAFNYTPENVEKLTITIAKPENSVSGYETCWRKNKTSNTKAIEVKWTGTTPTTPSEVAKYKVGDIGPAGGYVFYDCDADNSLGNADGLVSTECGWRFLEVAPEDLSYTNSSGTTKSTYLFGYYRTSSSGSNLTVGTKTAIGTGKANTEALVKAMGETAYTESSGTTKGIYAAKACADYSITEDGTVYDDWFLPSKDELKLMYVNLYKQGLGSFATYDYFWSSSEYGNDNAWLQYFGSGNQDNTNRYDNSYVRPVRAFK